MTRKEPSRRESARRTTATRFKLPRHILVAEDDSYTLDLNLRGLTEAGYKVAAAHDGQVAWETLQVFRYDLVVTDNCMPRMSGVELIEKMRAAHILHPVIMVTGAVPEAEFAAKPWLQPTAVLLKPYTIPELVAAVNKVLHATDAMHEEIEHRERSFRKRSAKSAPSMSVSPPSTGV